MIIIARHTRPEEKEKNLCDRDARNKSFCRIRLLLRSMKKKRRFDTKLKLCSDNLSPFYSTKTIFIKTKHKDIVFAQNKILNFLSIL